jgi:hypothetical protein
MSKRVAVLVRERQAEALRMALGLMLLDDTVDVYILDRKLADAADVRLHLATMREFDLHIYTNEPANDGIECLPADEIARRLPTYDHALPY